jgi:hypothetical protein
MKGKSLRGGLALVVGFLLGVGVGFLLARRWEEEAIPQEPEEKADLEVGREAPAKAAAPKPWVLAALTIGLGLVLLLVVAVAFENTSWSIYRVIRGPDEAMQERITSVRDTLATTGEAAKAVAALEQALQPGKDGTDVMAYLKAAIDELDRQSAHLEAESAERQKLDEARSALRGICVDLEATVYRHGTAQPTNWLFPLPTPAATPSW